MSRGRASSGARSQRGEGASVAIAAALVLFTVASYAALSPPPHPPPTIATIDLLRTDEAPAPTDAVDHPTDTLAPSAPASKGSSEVSPLEAPVPDAVPPAPQARAADTTAPPTLPEGTIVVEPNGSPEASGTYADPLDLATALGPESPVRPGGTVLLRGGTYHGTFTSTLNGTPTEPIVVRSFPGEWAVLDGGSAHASTLAVNGADTRFAAIEVTKSGPRHRATNPGSDPADLSRASATGIRVSGPRTKLLDVVVRDHGHGIGFWRPAVDAEIRGAVIFNNGWLGPDRADGHGIYVQNLQGTKRIADSLIFRNFGWGIHGFGVDSHVNGLIIEGVTSFENGEPAGARHPNLLAGTKENPVDRVTIRSNVLYHRPSSNGRNLQVGLGSGRNRSAKIVDNIVIGGGKLLTAINFEDLEVRGNVFHSERGPTESRFFADLRTLAEGAWPLTDPRPGYSWDQNTYIDRSQDRSGGSFPSFLFNSENRKDALTFPEWQEAVGVDRRSKYSPVGPSNVDVIVRPTGGGRAIITVLNWSQQRSVEIDLKEAGLALGAAFEIKDAQDFLGKPVVSGTWNGTAVEIPLDSHSITQPVGSGGHPVERTPIEFGAFVLQPR